MALIMATALSWSDGEELGCAGVSGNHILVEAPAHTHRCVGDPAADPHCTSRNQYFFRNGRSKYES